MTLHIENFGKIKKADIELDGLTVVAGQNDTGKSTIGKALFAIVKSISEYPELYEIIKNDRISFVLRAFSFEAVRDEEIRKDENLFNEAREIRNFLVHSGTKNVPPVAYSFIDHLVAYYEGKNDKSAAEKISALKKYADHEVSSKEKFEEIVTNVFTRTFLSEINNSKHFDNISKISYDTNNDMIAEISFKSNNLLSLSFYEDNKISCFSDATFLDTPLYLDDRFESELYYGFDVKQKLSEAQKDISSDKNSIIYEKIDSVLGEASFSVNHERKEWRYSVSKGAKSLSISNIASGSKSFGVLNILIRSGILKLDSILILDEPENHLHPEWQIKYAEILALMVREGYNILLTSHSPFFLQALRLYADKYGILENKAHFYLAEKINDGSNYSNIKDVTDKTEEIFANLAAPLDKLFMVD